MAVTTELDVYGGAGPGRRGVGPCVSMRAGLLLVVVRGPRPPVVAGKRDVCHTWVADVG